jgi:hypothetical protein
LPFSCRVDQAVDGSLWNIVPLLFNGCEKLLDIGRNWKMQAILQLPGIVYRSLRHGAMHYHAET